MTNRLTGSIFPDPAKQQPYRYGRREGGRFAIVPFESVSQSTIDALAAQADFSGLNYEVTLTHGKARIEIEYNYNNVVGGFQGQTTESEETWEIVPGKAMKDVLDSRNPLVLSCSQGALSEMKKRQKANTIGQSSDFNTAGLLTVQTWGPTTGPTNFTGVEMILYQQLVDGFEQVEIPAPVLTHTKIVTAQYITAASFTNIGKIISTATLISSEGVPGAVLFDFPVNSDPSPIPIGATPFSMTLLYGWLKNSPSVRQTSAKKWCITQTWDYGLWCISNFGGTRL